MSIEVKGGDVGVGKGEKDICMNIGKTKIPCVRLDCNLLIKKFGKDSCTVGQERVEIQS